MIKPRVGEAGLDPGPVCYHTFHGSGITAYLQNRDKLKVGQCAGHTNTSIKHLNHEASSTTKLYDRWQELVSKG